MTSRDYQQRLRLFYDRERISVARFECKHRDDCCRDASPRPLTFGAEAHVGSRYGESPRLVVISLDARGDSHGLIERQSCVEGLETRLNAHMRGTKETIEALLSRQPGGASQWPFFAMTNAAKCSGADGKGDKVPDALYQRCQPFAVEELRTLDPHVVVAQGAQARTVLEPLLPVPEPDLTTVVATLGVPDGSPVRARKTINGRSIVGGLDGWCSSSQRETDGA